MSFGSGGGFSFGTNNNNTQSTFGGFGSNSNTNSGFGSSNTPGAFGASTNNQSTFGGSTFGSNSGGFGNTNNSSSLFGNKPASNPFGASTNSGSGGLFGNSTNTGGGFGASTGGFGSNNSNTSAFGSNNNNASSSFSFGSTANKPAFGNTTSSTPLFGQGGSGTTSGFGTTNAFGSGTALSNQPVPPSEGTASTPFAPHIEKDGTGPASSAYQSIVFQQPYQKYSFEELRLADYNAGRQFGNNTGQAGGFGSNSFGGFGSTNTNTGGFGSNTTGGGLFGNNTTSASTGFGTTTSTTGFGGGGLFGNKPATGGGLFGTQSTASTTGGLFGTSNNTTNTGFGSTTGGGLFGNNQTQNKPNPFGTTTTTPSFSFGNSNAQTNSAPTGGLFGNTQQNNQSSGGLFGNNQQQSGGLFGNNNNQQKPLFGNSTGGFGTPSTQNQGGGLFNNSTPQNNSGGLFGNNNTQQQNTNTGGGLFGSNTNTSGGLFGGNNANNSAQKPGGLFGTSFGNTNNTTNTGGGLFGNSTTNQPQQSGGLFNNANNNTTSGFSFGNSASKPASTGLFNNTSTGQSGGLFGNSFNGLGASQNNQQNSQQQQDFRVSSLNDPNPYGQTSIWTGLPVPTPDNSKPIFTPLSASQKLKESQSKPPPSLRLNQSRYMTPPRRPGFGFSYSTYGTPNSAASTPGGGSLSNSMYGNRSFNGSSYGGSIGRSFGKSASVNNLRSQFNVADNDSVLSPNAFNPSHTRWSGGNMRRLTIDRSIRSDLFSRQSLPALTPPSPAERNVNGTPAPSDTHTEPPATEPTKLRKRVSFDKETTGGQNGTLNGESGALVRTEVDDDTPEPEPRGRPVSNGGVPADVQQARSNELAVVPEDRASDHVSPKKTAVEAKPDPQPGDYWMKPTRAQLSKLPRDKLQEFVGFEVGRKGCGRVTFLGAVDLTAIPLDDLYEKIVEIRLRSVTVYPDASSKPPVGKGLNVPSKISIENSWPRARGQPSSATSGPAFDKHVNRLKKMQGTEFVGYDVASGVWTFKVPHYTRYGLDYDDDDDLSRSQLSLPPDSLSGSQSEHVSAMEVDSESEENDDYDDDDEDDTFAFKQKTVPGGYGKRSVIEDYEMSGPNAQELEDGPESDLEEDENDDTENEVSMVGSFPVPAIMESPNKPILKASRMGTPGKALISLEGDWAEQLQRTISPRKQNREALRDVQSKVLLDRAFEPIKPRATKKDQLNTSIDIMNSLFSKHEERMTKGRKAQAGPDFEFPYAKRPKTFDDETEMSETDKSWHASFKPHFTATNGLVYMSNGEGVGSDAGWTTEALIVDDRGVNVVALTSLQGSVNQTTTTTMDIETLLADAQVVEVDGVPYLEHKSVPFSRSKTRLSQKTVTQTELDIYELGHVLFDDYDDEFSRGLSRQQQQEFAGNIRKDRLSKYLSSLIWRRHGDHIKASEKSSSAEAAILYLTAKNIKAACEILMKEKNFHLTLLVAQIASPDSTVQQDITEQLNAWREQGVISEMSEEIRALYEILAGNTGVCQGKQNVPTENRASTFSISEKFNLDWIQAFALSLWYGPQKSGNIQDAVKEFQEMLISEEEAVSPMDARGNEDPLWVLLKVFATQKKGSSYGLEKPTLPQALSILATPWTSQVIFRLHHAIVSSVPDVKVDQEKAEELAGSLSFELGAHDDVVGAAYALLHIDSPLLRTKHIKDLLNKHAAILSAPSKNGTDTHSQKSLFDILEQSLRIPTTWLYAAKALYARSTNDSVAELSYQILANDLPSAHETLLRRVAPRLIIDEDWNELSSILKEFGETPEEQIGAIAWSEGGGVYDLFVALMELDKSKKAHSDQESMRAKRRVLLQSLQKTLANLNAKDTNRGPLGKDKEKLEERVALMEMGRTVAAILKEDADGERSLLEKKTILDLPLTADARLSHVTALGVDYYRGVMAMAR